MHSEIIPRSVASKMALKIPSVLDEVISYLHIGNSNCPEETFEDAYYTVSFGYCGCRDEHLKSLLSCLFVAKDWAHAAIPQLWGHYGTLENVLALVCSKPPDDNIEMQRKSQLPSVDIQKIDRWFYYSRYITKLQFPEPEDRYMQHRGFKSELLLNISDCSNGRPLFPRLHTFVAEGEWLHRKALAELLSVVLSTTTKWVVLGFYEVNEMTEMMVDDDSDAEYEYGDSPHPRHLRDCLQIIAKKSPYLSHLNIQPVERKLDYMPSLHLSISVLQTMRHLTFLALPAAWVNIPVFKCIQNLPLLEILELNRDAKPYSACCFSYQKLSSPSSHDEGPSGKKFGSLKQLSICDSRVSIEEKLSPGFPVLLSLKTLNIELVGHPPSNELNILVPRVFPLLESYKLYVHGNGAGPTPVTESTLHLASNCTKLTSLTLDGFSLTNSILGDLVRACPELIKLCLSSNQPTRLVRQSVTAEQIGELRRANINALDLEGLQLIASHLEKLKELIITLVASDTSRLASGSDYMRHAFKNLSSLELYTSFLNFEASNFNEIEAATYISSLLSSDAEFQSESHLLVAHRDIIALASARDREESAFVEAHADFTERFCELVEGFRDKFGVRISSTVDN